MTKVITGKVAALMTKEGTHVFILTTPLMSDKEEIMPWVFYKVEDLK